MKYVLYMIAAILSLSGPVSGAEQRALFLEILAREEATPGAGFDDMTRLAETGFAPALDRVAAYYRHGVGTSKDLEAARAWYLRAHRAGHPWSTASLARVELQLNRADAALTLLETGAAQKRPGTQRLLATSHIDRKFGAASDPELGRRMLEHLAKQGDRNAARDLATRINWGRLNGEMPKGALDLIIAAGLEGDVRFAEVVLIYLSRQGDQSPANVQTRAHLADVPGLRNRVLATERIRLAAVLHPDDFWRRVERSLAETQPENYARAASTAFWINKNAWVRVLQKELRATGHYRGRINSRMTAATIKAQNQFCRDRGIWNECAKGPLRGATVRAVAHAIAHPE